MKKLSKGLYARVYSEWNGRYVTRIWTNKDKIVYQNDGLELDKEGRFKLLQLKCQGYDMGVE